MRRFVILNILAACCALSGVAEAIEIKNFKSGLACPDASSDSATNPKHICLEVTTVHITGQGRCSYDGIKRPCTWFGFEFDYSGATANDVLSCVVATNEAVNYGTPDSADARALKSYEYELPLEDKNGHIFNPQYAILQYLSENTAIMDEKTVCSVDDQQVIQFEFRFVYPVLIE
ncbi:hypothetical protein [Hyphococcus sp.]|uniref:hypothetical protein n=1 Tax=Hyphococcus sp. TaxID=2038636 RepID=UPI0035C6FE00